MYMSRSHGNSPASKALLNKLKRATGLNTENCYISVATAYNLLQNVNSGCDIETDLRALGAYGKPSRKYLEKLQGIKND